MGYSLGIALVLLTAKLLSIAGIGGFIAGSFSRRLAVALALGAAFGIIDSIILSMQWASQIPAASWYFAIIAGCGMASLGWALKGRKRLKPTGFLTSTREPPKD